jgi:F-type H+-transporting ATPase subunit b
MEIIPDPIHALLLLVPFAVTAIFLNVVLWKPLLAFLDERAATSENAIREAHELDHDAAAATAKLEDRLLGARNQAATLRGAARQRAQVKEGELVSAARRQAEERVGAAIGQIGAERAAASATLASTANDLSSRIAGRILGREVRSDA